MNLEFPTSLLFPLYPTRPDEDVEGGAAAFRKALRDFLNHLSEQNTATCCYFDAANVYFDDCNQESTSRSRSDEVTHEAIASVIKNITHPAKGEYVWDPAQNRWVLKLTPV